MAVTDYQRIRKAIEDAVRAGKRDFMIYPYGEYGAMTKYILNDSFGIREKYIVDDGLSRYHPGIRSLCKDLNGGGCAVLFTCANPAVYEETRSRLKEYFPDDHVIEIFENVRGG